ncbi:prepilin-type N-terminal cleavage/methylation domain-containing protein [Clostridium tertium]|uniref:Fimbrial protein n=1 Tax=Clostridium tertium TaxID=1559 RepID=A0A6N3GW28_9CLOT
MLKNLKNKKKKRGFTLIELIIVIAIIAILAVIAIPKFVDVRDKAARQTDIANAKTIANAAATLYANGDISNDADGDKVSSSSTGIGKTISDYLQTDPKTEAVYTNATKGSNFYIVIDGGDIEVHAGSATGEELYPEPASPTN